MNEKTNNTEIIEENSIQKKEKPTKEKKSLEGKKIKPKCYAGTNVEKLPKVPKKYMDDLMKVEALTPDQLEKYYTAIILGLIPDRFGLEASVDTKLKAAKGLTELREAKLKEQTIANEEEQSVFAIDFVIKQKKQADEMIKEDAEEESDVIEDASNY